MVKKLSKLLALLIILIAGTNVLSDSINAQQGIRFPTETLLPTTTPVDPSITVNPAYIIEQKKGGEILTSIIKITYKNINPNKIYNRFWEYDSEYKNRSESVTLKKITEIKMSGNSEERTYEIQIDTQTLEDRTYFFGIEFNVNSESGEASIQPDFGVNIPIILTINTNTQIDSVNPKPDFGIAPTKQFYLEPSKVDVNLQVLNSSDKLINFSGELLVIDDKNEIVYLEKITIPENRLLPREAVEQKVLVKNLEGRGGFPFIGRLRLAIRGTVNNSRYIETKTKEIYVIPYQVLIGLMVFLVITGFAANYLINRKIRSNKTRL